MKATPSQAEQIFAMFDAYQAASTSGAGANP
jgi:hypothetical protein